LLERFRGDRRRVIAITDTTGTVHAAAGIDVEGVLAWKRAGRPLAELPGSFAIDAPAAVAEVDADVVADATATELGRAGWTDALDLALRRGACVVSAAKAALCEAGAEWLSGELRARVGCNAVLGATGRSFMAELPELQRHARAIAVIGNASTTAIIEAIERGGTIDDGIDAARRLGYLEADPELDLRGADAAVKLAIVAGAVTGRRIDPHGIPCDDVRDLDIVAVRARARRHATTRLVARLSGTGLRVAYEEIARDSILAVPIGRVVYEYRLRRDERRLHIGSGLGPDATAGAMWSDIRALAGAAGLRAVHAPRAAVVQNPSADSVPPLSVVTCVEVER
jgi:homoserine dehydrogenase